MSSTMKAAVIHEAGGPEALKIEQRPIPSPNDSQVLIRVKAFGVNRAELFTRQGHSPGVKFPRVLGIEATGIVASCPGGQFSEGEAVATCMGGMGRDFDGGYAEYTCVPVKNVRGINVDGLDWTTIGAVPEMLQTAWSSLFKSLRLQKGERLLVRGGTSSIGLAAASIAKNYGAVVGATTRNPKSEALLKEAGVDEVIIDDGNIHDKIKQKYDKVLELIGVTTLADSLRCVTVGGICCMTGILGNKWTIDDFAPMDVIPTAVSLTVYAGGPEDFMAIPLAELMDQVRAGSLKLKIGKVFRLDEIVEAHRAMDENRAGGKIVVLT